VSLPAGDELELLRQFVNTRQVDTQIDVLDSPDRLREWLSDHGLLANETVIDQIAHKRALEFREAVRSLALANGDTELDANAIATLNRVGADIGLSIAFAANGRGELGPAGAGLDRALGRLYAILYTAMIDGSFERLKGCANDTCLWLFYDESKNRSKKWCDMQTCGNAANARSYRQRRRDSSAS
jgi:predicted RNA-binding Zn ribbon-like protein